MPLKESHKRHLRALAHKLKPLIIIGQHGVTESVINEIDLTLEHHELIKIRVNAADRIERKQLIDEICQRTQCEMVQGIGHIAIVYRRARKPRIQLS